MEKKSVFKNLLPQYKISGFDPNEALTKVIGDVDENGQTQESLFLKFLPALEWFLTVYPDGCLNHSFVTLSDKKATVTASIYRCQSDTRPAATATCTRYFEENNDGKYYEQNAVTAAYRKALGYLGFGTPPDAVEVDGILVENEKNIPERTDGGVKIVSNLLPSTIEEKTVVEPAPKQKRTKTEKQQTAFTESFEKPVGAIEECIQPVVSEPRNQEQQVSPVVAISEQQVQEQQPETTEVQSSPATLNGAVAASPNAQSVPKTYDEALEIVVPYGDMVGKTVSEAAKERGNSFIRWHCDKAQTRIPNSPFAMATQLYCEFNGC